MDIKSYNLESLSDSEIKTVEGGTSCGWEFPYSSRIIAYTLCTAQNAKTLFKNTLVGLIGLI
jgi:hypothetical protein